tara:strand:+ start:330 stop:1049 length:720 start_codon:yes stop_codon:yes gene_type:complete
MLLFPCSKIQGTPRIGLTITNTCPSLKCFARIFLDGQIIQEPVLDNINTFIEIPISKSTFSIKFSFHTASENKTTFAISNMTYGGMPYNRRYPLCLLQQYDNDPKAKIVNLFELWQFKPEQSHELNFDGLEINHTKVSRNKAEINGKSAYLGLPKVGIVDNFKIGQGFILSSVFPTWYYHFEILRWTKLRLKITNRIDDIKPNRHYIRSYKINSVATYFEFLHHAFGIALAAELADKYV